MKRSTALTQLSREHHLALVLAKRAQSLNMDNKEAVLRLMAQIVETFARELEPHFQLEEDWLLPALSKAGATGIVRRTLTEHAEVRRLANQIKLEEFGSVPCFGAALAAHVRFEERELFALAEALLKPEDLDRAMAGR